mgnify:CR=1 FL=1
MDTKTGGCTKTYETDKIDDLICELDDSKIRINALIDYHLKLTRVNQEQENKNLLAHEYERLSPIIELLNTEIFESLQKSMKILSTSVDDTKIHQVK